MHWTSDSEADIEWLLIQGRVFCLERQEGGVGASGEGLGGAGGKEDAEFRNCAALASGQTPMIFIHIIIFMWKGTCNSLGSAICLQALVCPIWIQCQFSTVNVHGWHVYVGVYVYVCSGVCMARLCVCPRCWHKRQSILGLSGYFLPPTHLPNVSRIIN